MTSTATELGGFENKTIKEKYAEYQTQIMPIQMIVSETLNFEFHSIFCNWVLIFVLYFDRAFQI